MNKSESIKHIATALSKFQQAITNPHNSATNPFFKSKYAPLNDVINHIKKPLSEQGLSFIQSTSGDGSDVVVTTLLMHDSGEWIESDPLHLKAEKNTAQGVGSAITYGRRYSLSAVLGISSEDDDDANQKQAEPKKEEKLITQAQRTRLFAVTENNEEILRDAISQLGYTSTKDILQKDYDNLVELIKRTVEVIKQSNIVKE
jgi:hypothetical protein